MCITDLANSIFIDLGEPDNISIPSISYWLRNAVKNGKLSNTLLDDYELVSGEISPSLDSGGEDILKLLYKIYYIERIVLDNLSQASLSSIQSFKEGNRSVIKFNKNEIAKTYKDLLKETKQDLKDAMTGYQNKKIQDEQIATSNVNLYCSTCYPSDCYCGRRC